MPDIDIKLNLITASALISIGAICGMAYHSHITELQRNNDALMDINRDLIQENDSLRYCVPKKGGRAVVTYVSGRLFCEVHNVARKF